uniref:Uncharacterized protein n=1 Tax=uncultured marine thaumarchaeote SAT1000_12_G12 TaxID=1456380 RepID=A0A075I8Q8_9ARCH|nr:hypothetical protein [uncultured marine thaumarchaeote SAT1000_12_G12]
MRETERGKFLDLCKDALDDLEAEMILIMKNLDSAVTLITITEQTRKNIEP